MLTKKFKSNKFYEVTRYVFKYGKETDALGQKESYVYDKDGRVTSVTDKRGLDRKSTRLNSSHSGESRMPSSA